VHKFARAPQCECHGETQHVPTSVHPTNENKKEKQKRRTGLSIERHFRAAKTSFPHHRVGQSTPNESRE